MKNFIKSISYALMAMLLLSCAGPVEEDQQTAKRGPYTISGVVLAPLTYHHLFTKPSLAARLVDSIFRPLMAAISGVSPVAESDVELVRLDSSGTVIEILETQTTGVDGSYTFTSTEAPNSSLAVRAVGTAADGITLVEMRALVTADTGGTISPLSEVVTDSIVTYLEGSGVWLENYTINEIDLLTALVNDLDIDITGLAFDEAIAKITAVAGALLDELIVGFSYAGEEPVFDEFETYNLLELRLSLIAPNVTYTRGADEYYGSLGGGVTFDNNGLVTGSGIYYWSHLTDFAANARFRLFDQAMSGISGANLFVEYPDLIGFNRIVVGAKGKAITGASDGESTVYGFMSNDKKLLGFPVSKDDRLAALNNYDIGMRVLMKKFSRDSEPDSSAYGDPTGGDTNTITGGSTSTVWFANDILDDPDDAVTTPYNVVQLQYFLNGNGIEASISTSTHDFDSSQQLSVSDGLDPSTLIHGRITPTWNFSTLRLETNAAAALSLSSADNSLSRFEPTLFTVIQGGVMMLRRESSSYIHAATGAVAENGQYFIAPQIFDDIEDDINVRLATNGRRGWYVGVRQSAGLRNANLLGEYNAVGVVTHLSTANGGTVKHENVYGTVEFDGATDDSGNGNVAATLYSRAIALDGLDGTVAGGFTVVSEDEPLSYTGVYNVSDTDGSITTYLQETVTNYITKQVTGAVSQDGQFIVLPIKNNTTRGILILSHVRVKLLDVPPDPPGPPDAPFDTPPSLLPPGP